MATSSASVSVADLQALLGALPDAVLTSDSTGHVEFLNRATERLTGHSRETVLGHPVDEVLPLGNEVDGTPLENPVAGCLRGEGSLGPFAAMLLDGPNTAGRVVEVSAAPIRDPAGAITGTILVARDVTRARQLTRQLSHQATHDALTGLVNRTEFERRLTRPWRARQRRGQARRRLRRPGRLQADQRCLRPHRGRRTATAGEQSAQGIDADPRHRGPLGRRRIRNTARALRSSEGHSDREGIRKTISDYRFTCGGRTYSALS